MLDFVDIEIIFILKIHIGLIKRKKLFPIILYINYFKICNVKQLIVAHTVSQVPNVNLAVLVI